MYITIKKVGLNTENAEMSRSVLCVVIQFSIIFPFITPIKSQIPAFMGLQVGTYYQYDQITNYGSDFVD
jgi:hypothetical protein